MVKLPHLQLRSRKATVNSRLNRSVGSTFPLSRLPSFRFAGLFRPRLCARGNQTLSGKLQPLGKTLVASSQCLVAYKAFANQTLRGTSRKCVAPGCVGGGGATNFFHRSIVSCLGVW